MKKIPLMCVGLIASGLAIVGVWTPGLPTTPFLILALWAFAGSSEKLHNWLSHTPILKSAMIQVDQFKETKTIKREVKIFAQICAWGSFLFILLVNGPYSIITFIVFCAAVSSSIAMYRINTAK